jgi:hypothetical protein
MAKAACNTSCGAATGGIPDRYSSRTPPAWPSIEETWLTSTRIFLEPSCLAENCRDLICDVTLRKPVSAESRCFLKLYLYLFVLDRQ